MPTARNRGPLALFNGCYCVLFAVSLCAPSLVIVGLGVAEVAGLAVAVVAVLAAGAGLAGSDNVEGAVAMLEGTEMLGVAAVLVAGWLADEACEVAGLIGTVAATGAAAATGAEGAARVAGALFEGAEALMLAAALFAGALFGFAASSRAGALSGRVLAASTAGLASATTVGASAPVVAGVVWATAAAGGVTSAIVLSAT